ncbi:MAG: hypothetical protein WDZ85_00405 [Candidatus Paceibacterota bacterium]
MKNISNQFSQILTLLLIPLLTLFFTWGGIVFYESSEVAWAATANDEVLVTLTVESGISITSPADVSMSPDLSITADASVGSTTWNVKTNDPAGYDLTVNAGAAPAMVRSGGGGNVLDYTASTPEQWSPAAGNAYFGFSSFGTDVTTGTWGTDGTCEPAATLGGSAERKYRGFDSTTPISIATRSATTTTAGIDSTVCFAAEQNSTYAEAGTYTATITATATTN